MTAVHDDLHGLVDRLTPDQAEAVRAVVLQLVVGLSTRSGDDEGDDAGGRAEGTPRRRLSFAGLLHSGKGDLAARSEDILRDELGRYSA
jgi:hypothetical protein